jgi:hypothetical protein
VLFLAAMEKEPVASDYMFTVRPKGPYSILLRTALRPSHLLASAGAKLGVPYCFWPYSQIEIPANFETQQDALAGFHALVGELVCNPLVIVRSARLVRNDSYAELANYALTLANRPDAVEMGNPEHGQS